jgi:hypothetical protein
MKEVTRNPMYQFLLVMSVASVVGLQAWRTLFNNFAVEIAHLEGNHVGMIQSAREIPGFLALLAVFAMMVLREHRLSALSVFVLGLGVAITGLFPTYGGLLLTTVVMSFGYHYFETTNQSLTLQYFDKKSSPWVFGKLRSFGAASNIATGIFIYLVAGALSYRQIYLLIGALIVLVGIWGFTRDPTHRGTVPQRRKMVFRRKYWLFYLLAFMAGARRQIFVAFAVFLLVKKFDFTVQEITILFVVNNVVNYFLTPLIGKSIIRFGERKVLSAEYFSLLFIFLAYTAVQSRIVVAGLYVLDNIFFNFAIAIRTYFQKVGDSRDIAPSMAVGFTVNHIAAVVFPAIGGLLWMVDYRIPFVGGAVISLISLIAAQRIKTGE